MANIGAAYNRFFIIKINRLNRCGPVFDSNQVRADFYGIAWLDDNGTFQPRAVQKCSIAAVEVFQVVGVALYLDGGMSSGNFLLIQGDVIFRASANDADIFFN